jgi:hypothetical protein
MADIMRTIRDGIKTRVASVAGDGVRALGALQNPGVNRYTTFTQSFEVVLTKGYIQSTIDDTEQVEKSYDLRAIMLDIYTDLVNTKAGVPASVMNIFNLEFTEPEYLEEDKVVVTRYTMDITFRLTL